MEEEEYAWDVAKENKESIRVKLQSPSTTPLQGMWDEHEKVIDSICGMNTFTISLLFWSWGRGLNGKVCVS